jgi:hypothetical protein
MVCDEKVLLFLESLSKVYTEIQEKLSGSVFSDVWFATPKSDHGGGGGPGDQRRSAGRRRRAELVPKGVLSTQPQGFYTFPSLAPSRSAAVLSHPVLQPTDVVSPSPRKNEVPLRPSAHPLEPPDQNLGKIDRSGLASLETQAGG